VKKLSVVTLLGLFVFVGILGNFAFATVRLADPRVRQAIAYAIDVDTICETLLEGKASPADCLTPDKDWKAEGLNDYKYNPTKAKQLLKEAGWDSNYVLDVVYYYGDQLTVDLMTAVQAYLADVGIKMKFRKLEGDLTTLLWTPPQDPAKGPSAVNWDLAYAGISALTLHEYYNRFRSGASSNSHTPTDPELDRLIDAINATADTEEQRKAFIELTKYENETLPEIPLYYQQGFIVESKRVNRKGIPYGNEQFAYDWRIIDWDIQPDKNGERILYTNGGPVEFFEGPFVNPATSTMPYLKLLFDRLIIADEKLNPKKGQLASEYSVSKDGLTIEFVLRDGIKWHDGVPITPEDVKFTFEYYAKVPQLNAVALFTISCLKGYDDYMQGNSNEITGIVIDGNKVTFYFDKLDPNALMTFSQWPPLPKHLLENTDPLQAQRASYWQRPVGSGPFKIEDVKMNNYVTYVRWDDYWDKGTGNIEKIQSYPSGESDPNLVINTEAGKVDFAYTKSVEQASAIEQISHVNLIPFDMRFTRLFYVNKFPLKDEL